MVLAIWDFTLNLGSVYQYFHKAVAEVSKIGDHRKSTGKVVGVVPFGMVAVVASPTTAGCSVVWCGVVAVVV